MNRDAKVALWHRLRNDPDFTPEWFGFMGHRPPVAEAQSYRSWADGATDEREHVIADISFRERWITCRCGENVTAAGNAALEDQWDLHRGLSPEVVASRRLEAPVVELATSEEVRDFLGRASNLHYSYE